MKPLARHFGWSLGLTLMAFAYVLLFQNPAAGLTVLILAAIELAFSFDNAVINAKVLGLLSPLWQKLFLSLGIILAVFGVRLALPLLIVGWSARLPFGKVADLALHHPHQYAVELALAHPGITAFGGAFLLMLVLHFFLAERDIHWVEAIERPLSRLASWWLPLVVTFVVILGLSTLPVNEHHRATLVAGLIGMLSYAAINGLIELAGRAFGKTGTAAKRVGWAAFATFGYLELLDASLSFDGVIGAFAITNEVVLIALGLGIGAIWVRSLTVYMVRRRALETYRYLEHGAHYAIGVLAATMLLGTFIEVSDYLTGVLCLGIIAAAVVTSRQALERSA
ncbi:MAG TPA: DUF475 domain-containing protein [Candidatus Saccharimonadales bacterium]|nr:DUF475 domain-containing protein [Candidatus Saccharimonadales bacterium]